MNRLLTFRNIATLLLCSLFLASCSNDDEGGETLPAGAYPVTFDTQISKLKSTSGGTWNAGDEVAIQIAGTVKKYTAATDGKLTNTTSPFYWQGQSEIKTAVQGWYPYSVSVPTSWTVQSNQSGNGYQTSDLLFTPPTDISFGGRNTTSLPFYHQTAKVVINIVNAEAATSTGNIAGVEIGYANNLALVGTYAIPTGSDKQGAWTASTTNKGTITPKEDTSTPPTGILKSYEALVIPQDMTDNKFIAVTHSNGNTYYYTPTGTDGILQGGKEYLYSITVKNGYLEVKLQTAEQWTDGGQQAITSKEIKTSYTATDLKPGDYYYNDGTWSDGGLRRIHHDGTGGGAGSVSPVNSKTVMGIIFWVGNPTEPIHNNGTAFTDFGDPALRNEKPQCIHGLVVALEDVSAAMKWQNTASSISSAGTSYESITTNDGANDALNKLRGYNNTQVIRAYNTSVGSSSPHLVLPMQAIDNWAENNLAPVSSSGWYFPSEKELTLLCGRDVNNLWLYNSGGTGMRNIVDTAMENVSGAMTISQTIAYWSSSEDSNSNAWCLLFTSGMTLYTGKTSAYNNIRPILAF